MIGRRERNALIVVLRWSVPLTLAFWFGCAKVQQGQSAPQAPSAPASYVPAVTLTTLPVPVQSSYTEPPNDHAQYHVIYLQGPSPAVATAINDRGAVVGEAQTGLLTGGYGPPINFGLAFLWYKGKFTSIGALPINPAEDFSASVAYGINNHDVVVGGSGSFGAGPMDGLMFCSVFVYKNGTMTGPFVTAGTADESEQAYGVNDAGTIVGNAGFHGFVYLNGVKIELKPLSDLQEGNGTVGVAVNNGNEVVGATTTGTSLAHPRIHAFLWRRPGRGALLDLGSLTDFPNSIATAINRNGAIVGYTTKADNDDVASGKFIGNRDPRTLEFRELIRDGHAFVWRDGTMSDLGALDGETASAAFGINEKGLIVGSSGDRAVLWENGSIHDLNTMIPKNSGWALVQARAINNHGWIAGWGTFKDGDRAFLLIPHGQWLN